MISYVKLKTLFLQWCRGLLSKKFNLWGYMGKIKVNYKLEQDKIVVGEASTWEFHKATIHGKKLLKWNLHLTWNTKGILKELCCNECYLPYPYLWRVKNNRQLWVGKWLYGSMRSWWECLTKYQANSRTNERSTVENERWRKGRSVWKRKELFCLLK